MLEQTFHYVDNHEGWKLELKHCVNRQTLVPSRRPVVIVPGYGMNAFIFGYHPKGLSMEAFLVEQGFEVWSVNLRAQGGSLRKGGDRYATLHDLGVTDLSCAFDFIIEHTLSETDQLDAVGCSLGGTLLFIHLALVQTNPLHSVVNVGGPLRWTSIHPLLKAAFGSPWLAGSLPIRGIRPLARLVLPVIQRLPNLLKIYLHPEITDISNADELVQTVEDPNPKLNREISLWMKSVDLFIKGTNITEALRPLSNPLFVMTANADGVVPRETSDCALEILSGEQKRFLEVGTEEIPFAHADMFISDYSQEWVFTPLADWLKEQQGEGRADHA